MTFLKSLLRWIVAVFGRRVRDERTGQMLGKALVLSSGGRAWLVGLHHPYVRPVFLPENRVKYGRQRIGFATHPPVDFPRLLPPSILHPEPSIQNPISGIPNPPPSDVSAFSFQPSAFHSSTILWAILVHQSAEECRAILARWLNAGFDPSCFLLVHGGAKTDFDQLDFPNAVFVPDADLRTVRHPVEKQSYSGPAREISRWMSGRPFRHICLVEYDHLPLVSDWGHRLLELLNREKADALFHHLVRADGTNAPHYLYHLADPRFQGAWEAISKREDPHVVLNCMATGSFWTREAFDAVAAVFSFRFPPCPAGAPVAFPATQSTSPRDQEALSRGCSAFASIYLEMDLPTTAHHLGFRVRDMGDQNPFVTITPRSRTDCEPARAQGAWSLHPLKG